MLITCDNKGCLQASNALINAETLEVMCSECNNVINNVSDAMKRVLKSSGQILRTEQKKSFTMGCKECNANRQVVLDEKDNTVCSVCGNVINVHLAMRQAILETGDRLTKQTNAKKQTRKSKKRIK